MHSYSSIPGARVATGLSGIICGAFSASAAFVNGKNLGTTDTSGLLFGAAFAAVVVGSWFLPGYAAEAWSRNARARAVTLWIGWAITVAFVLVNAVGFTALHRSETVGHRAIEASSYDRAQAQLETATAELAAAKANPRWLTTAGCTNATAERSRAFCEAVQAKQAEIQAARAVLDRGKPASVDAQADTLAWVTGQPVEWIRQAVPVFLAVVLELAASLLLWASMKPAVEERAPTPATTALPAAPAAARKAPRLPRPATAVPHPLIVGRIDGRVWRGIKNRVANDNIRT